jgi:hypothetical protein
VCVPNHLLPSGAVQIKCLISKNKQLCPTVLVDTVHYECLARQRASDMGRKARTPREA